MKLQFLVKKRILVISPEAWDHIPVSKHHYSRELALANEVYFLNPPSQRNGVHSTPEYGNLKVVNYRGIPGINYLPATLRDFFNKILLNRIVKQCGGHFDVVWTFDPFRFQNLALFKASVRIYHAVDIHKSPQEHVLAESCDIILSVSNMILDRFNPFDKIRVKINHGLASHFLKDPDESVMVKKTSRLRVGYVGNLDNWCIDRPTLLAIVKNNENIDFDFIGPYGKNSSLALSLKHLKNARLIGKVPSSELPARLKQCDLFLMCYDGKNREVNSNHHKIIEYLATGKPIVMNYTDEYKDKRDMLTMADENHQLPGLFTEVVDRYQELTADGLRQKRIAFAQSNSYSNHVATIDGILMKRISNVSVSN